MIGLVYGRARQLGPVLTPVNPRPSLPAAVVAFASLVASSRLSRHSSLVTPSVTSPRLTSPRRQAASVVALRFNRHHNLRRALGQVGFMTRGQPVALCPMLEQEVAGYNLLLQTLVVLSRGMDVDSGEPVEGGVGWPFAQVSFKLKLELPRLFFDGRAAGTIIGCSSSTLIFLWDGWSIRWFFSRWLLVCFLFFSAIYAVFFGADVRGLCLSSNSSSVQKRGCAVLT